MRRARRVAMMSLGTIGKSSRGGGLVEYLVLVAMAALCVIGGFRLASARFGRAATQQAACVSALDSTGCNPGAPERHDGPIDERNRFAPEPATESPWQRLESMASAAWASAPLAGAFGGTMVTATRAPAVNGVSATQNAKRALPEIGGCFTVPGGGGESIQVTTTIGNEEVSAEVSASNVFVESGRTFVTLTFRASRSQVAGLEADLGRHGFEVQVAAGEYVDVSITVPIDSNGQACVPDLASPASWPVGTSLRFEVGLEASASGSVTIYNVEVGQSVSRSEGVAVVIVKSDPDHVMILGGSTEAISNATWLGLSIGRAGAGIISEDEYRVDELVVAEIDLRDGSVRAGRMTVESAGGKVSGYVELDVGVEIRFEWTMTERGWELTTLRYQDGQVVETHTVYDEAGRTTWTVVDGVQGDLTVSYLTDGGTAAGFPGAPACLDSDRDYVVQWVAAPADIDALVAFVAHRYQQALDGDTDPAMLHLNCVADEVPMYPSDDPHDLRFFAQHLSYCAPTELEALLLEYQREHGSIPGRIEILDPNTGLPVAC